MGNHAVQDNPPSFQGVFADIHITNRGSDWYWTVFCIFSVSAFAFMGLAFTKPASDRIFHYITTAIVIVAAVAYFTMASDLGFVPVRVEYNRGGKVSGNFRQVFYARYIDWSITTPLLLLDLLLTAAVPWSVIIFTIFMDLVMIITGLIGALVVSRYKWGYFAFGCLAFLFVVYALLIVARPHARALGPEVSRAFNIGTIWLLVLWFLYPIAWGVSEGGNVIPPDSEAVFYGVLDVLAKTGFGILMLFLHRKIDVGILGLRMRQIDQPVHGPYSHSATQGIQHEKHVNNHHNGVTTTGHHGVGGTGTTGVGTTGNTGVANNTNPGVASNV